MRKNKNKKLLCILQIPPPFHGVSIMNSMLLDIFKNNGFDIIFLRIISNKNIDQIGKFNFAKIINSFKILICIFLNFNRFKYSYLVYSTEGFALYRDIIFIIFLKLLRKKVILHLRGRGFSNYKGFTKKLLQLSFKNTYIIQHSKLLSYDVEGFSYLKAFYVPNGFPDKFANNSYKKKEKNLTNILFLSNLSEFKGLFITLLAIKELKNKNVNFVVHFIGNWLNEETKNKFYSLIKEYDIQSYIGEVKSLYEDEKYEFIYNCDFLIFPSYIDAFGNVNLEAMMFEKPIIAANTGSVPEIIIDNETGLLVKPKDPIDLANKMLILIQNPELRIKMGKNGRKRYEENFTLAHFEKNIIAVFNEVFNDSCSCKS